MTQGSQWQEEVERRGPLSRRLDRETTPVLKLALDPFPTRAGQSQTPAPSSPGWGQGIFPSLNIPTSGQEWAVEAMDLGEVELPQRVRRC